MARNVQQRNKLPLRQDIHYYKKNAAEAGYLLEKYAMKAGLHPFIPGQSPEATEQEAHSIFVPPWFHRSGAGYLRDYCSQGPKGHGI